MYGMHLTQVDFHPSESYFEHPKSLMLVVPLDDTRMTFHLINLDGTRALNSV